MIGRGKLFDIVSRTANDVNNPEITVYNMLENFKTRKAKFDNENSKNDLER